MKITAALTHLMDANDLSYQDMQAVMQSIMTGQADDAQIAGFLIALRMKGETIEEISAAASVMRELSLSINVDAENAVDIVGTGGDASHTFNISTASSIVAAAAGATVAKHGNRSVSSKSGAADVLEAAGVNLNLDHDKLTQCIDNIGIGFMFAPTHHTAMKHAIGARRSLAARTIFNMLGPLTNPADVKHIVLGVFDQQWCEPMAQVLADLGCKHAMVVHSEDGMDEISISAPTHVVELRHGKLDAYTIEPSDFAFQSTDISNIQVDGPEQSLAMLNGVFNNEASDVETAAKNVVCLNAGAALYVAGITETHLTGVQLAKQTIENGQAAEKFQQLIAFTNA